MLTLPGCSAPASEDAGRRIRRQSAIYLPTSASRPRPTSSEGEPTDSGDGRSSAARPAQVTRPPVASLVCGSMSGLPRPGAGCTHGSRPMTTAVRERAETGGGLDAKGRAL